MPSATLLSPPTQIRPLGSAFLSGCIICLFFCRQEGALQPAGVPRAEAAELAAQVAHLERQVSNRSPGTMAAMHSGNRAGEKQKQAGSARIHRESLHITQVRAHPCQPPWGCGGAAVRMDVCHGNCVSCLLLNFVCR